MPCAVPPNFHKTIHQMKLAAIFLNICFLIVLPFAIRFAFFYQILAHYLSELGLTKQADASTDALYYNTLAFPVLIAASNLLSWFFLIRRKYPAAFYTALLPLLSVAVFVIIIFFLP